MQNVQVQATSNFAQKQGSIPSAPVGFKNPPVEHRFKPGVSANPGGKPLKSRNKLQGDFFRELADDFNVKGKDAIKAMREERPADYIKVIASLTPRELEVTHSPLEDMSTEALEAAIAAVQGLLANQPKGDVLDVVAKEQSD